MAEDAVQEAFIQAFRHIDQLRDQNKVGAWLAVIAMNRAKKLKREATRAFPMDGVEPPIRLVRDEVSLVDDRIMIEQLFRGMAPEDQQMLILKYFFELSDREIAALLKIAPGTVKSRLNRLRTRCKLILAGTDVGFKDASWGFRQEVETHER